MSFKFHKLDEKLHDNAFINREVSSNYKIQAKTDIEPGQVIYSGHPFFEYTGNPKLSHEDNINELHRLINVDTEKLSRKHDFLTHFSDVYPRSFSDLAANPYSKNIFGGDEETLDVFADLSQEEFTLRILAIKTDSNSFSNNSQFLLYKTGSYFNHSCVPNCLVSFKGDYIEIRSQRKIAQNEELDICYADYYIFDEKKLRNKLIFNERHFICKCHACTNTTTFPTQVFYYEKLAMNKVLSGLCHFCGVTGKELLVCTCCKIARYCSPKCQKLHWKLCHKTITKLTSTKLLTN